MNPQLELLQTVTRRHFLGQSSCVLGTMALASFLGADAAASPSDNPLAPKKPQYAPKARRMIYIHLTGSPPNLDLFDYKPELVKRDGQPCPAEYTKGKRFAFTSGTPKLLGTRRTFKQHGKSGLWLSDAVPHLAEVADELCLVHSMYGAPTYQ
ncbi:MAG: DUF1501 domain-containing protein [Thermoguttaceae bacterium]